jgi:BirA family biotin operon repressor/biotin-[acetyl-CoA-carboxylase] ligase
MVFPGTWLAKRLGLTRASVWKHIKALKAAGLPIESVRHGGYRFRKPFDFSLLHLASKNRLSGAWKLHYELQVNSTQLRAKQAAELHIPEKHIWAAETQTAGRGRLGRTWSSSPGGLWMSLLLRPHLAPAQVPALTLLAALEMAQAIKKVTGVDVRLKWPNDLVALVKASGGKAIWKKVGGILTEMSGELDRARWVVVGMGINVNNTLPPSLRSSAASLLDLTHGRSITRSEILREFIRRFDRSSRQMEREGFGAFRRSYWQLYARPDEPVQLRTAWGMIRGLARGVDDRGALIVESRDQTRHLFEGEIIR